MDEIKSAKTLPQYSLMEILGIWAAVALPMGFILWVAMPLIIPHTNIEPGFIYLVLITLGLVWQGIVAYVILRWEVKPFTWENVKQRLWLHTPTDPKTGVPSKKLYLWTIPIIAFTLLWDNLNILGGLNDLWLRTFPFLSPPQYAIIQNLAEPAIGQWWLMGVLIVLIAFNYLLGEELIFRGILLPKMNGVFGKWDIVANGILFAGYHLHLIWRLPSTIILRDWVYSWAAKRYKSYWVAVIIHGFDAVFLVVLFLMAIMGLIKA